MANRINFCTVVDGGDSDYRVSVIALCSLCQSLHVLRSLNLPALKCNCTGRPASVTSRVQLKYKLLCPSGTQTCALAVANIKVNGNTARR